MRQSRFTEAQIIVMIKEQDAGCQLLRCAAGMASVPRRSTSSKPNTVA
jgi:hypothetical protein